MKTVAHLSLFASTAALAACSFMMRSPDEYRDATKGVLDKQTASIASCYNQALMPLTDSAAQQAMQGTVTVHFMVEHETGKLLTPSVDASKTTAPQALQTCVTQSFGNLVLNPPDKKDGDATFAWAFTLGAAGASGVATGTVTPASAPSDGTSGSSSSPSNAGANANASAALPSGSPCDWKSKCPNDPPMDKDEHDECVKNLGDAKCGSLGLALATCGFANQPCGADGKTDDKAAEGLRTGACKAQFDAYTACSGR
jgi:hypothetical protein